MCKSGIKMKHFIFNKYVIDFTINYKYNTNYNIILLIN